MTISERIIDLHEDIADYLMTERNASLTDTENGQATLPKYAKANVALVVAAIFPLMRSWSPYVCLKFLAVGMDHRVQLKCPDRRS